MSLVNKPTVSETKIAANWENGSLSPGPRAAEAALANSEALPARRRQESNVRKVRRLTLLLLKIQRSQRRSRAREARERAAGTHDVLENKDS
jgi:hypothetical protein